MSLDEPLACWMQFVKNSAFCMFSGCEILLIGHFQLLTRLVYTNISSIFIEIFHFMLATDFSMRASSCLT